MTAPEDGCNKNDDDSENNFDQGGIIREDYVDEEFKIVILCLWFYFQSGPWQTFFPRDSYPNYSARSEKTIDVVSLRPANCHTLYKWPPHLIIESFSFCVLSQSNIKPGSLPAFLLNE